MELLAGTPNATNAAIIPPSNPADATGEWQQAPERAKEVAHLEGRHRHDPPKRIQAGAEHSDVEPPNKRLSLAAPDAAHESGPEPCGLRCRAYPASSRATSPTDRKQP